MVSTRWRPAENHGRRLTLYSAVPRYWNVRGVAGFRLQPPDESQSFVRERIDRLKLRDEFSDLRIVERSNQAGNIELREMVVHSGPQELLLKDALEIETVAENHLCKQVIRPTRHTHTQPKIDFPFGREIQVNGGENLLLLLADRVEACDRTQRTVILNAPGDLLGEIVAEFEVGREYQPLIHARAMEGPVKRGIEGEIPPAELFIHNRADLPRPGIRGVPAVLPPDFIRKADADGPVPLGWNAQAGADVAANVVPTLAVLRGSENVEAGFKPAIKSMGDLDGFVPLVVGGKCAVICGFGALQGEIGVELHHGVVRLDGFVRIHLDFVVPLSVCGQRQGRAPEQTGGHRESSRQSHIQSLAAPRVTEPSGL